MSMQELPLEEMDRVHGGRGQLLKKAVEGCAVGASAGSSTAAEGYGLLGGMAGCLAGASVAMMNGSTAAQTAAGWAAGAGFGPYAGSSMNVSAANYENSMDRANPPRRMSSI